MVAVRFDTFGVLVVVSVSLREVPRDCVELHGELWISCQNILGVCAEAATILYREYVGRRGIDGCFS